MKRLNILPSGAYSIIRVAKSIYNVLKDEIDCKLYLGCFTPQSVKGKCLIIGNPHFWEKRLHDALIRYVGSGNFIFYMTVEGNIRKHFLHNIEYLRDGVIVAVTNYVKQKLRLAGFDVDKVIYHGVDIYGDPKSENRKVFGYIAGYLKRKYPLYGISAIMKADIDFRVITTANNPYKKYFSSVISDKEYTRFVTDQMIQDFYKSISFYLNLSDAEGFGLTPLEAMAFGNPVIAPDIPPFREFLPDFTLWVRATGKVWYENWGNWLDIEHWIYSPNEMVRQINRALSMSDSTYGDLSRRCIDHAKKLDARRVYLEFLDLI